MKAPDPQCRVGKDIEFLGTHHRGQELIEFGIALAQKLLPIVKKKIPGGDTFADDALILQVLESNIFAIFSRVLRRIQQLHDKDPQFFAEALSSALDGLVDHSQPSLAVYFDEIIDLVMQFAFPQGGEDLILPIQGMIARFIRPKIWTTLSETIRKECHQYLEKLISVQSREALFCTLLQYIESSMKGYKKKSVSYNHTSEHLKKSIATFLIRYVKSISLNLFHEREEDILFTAHPLAIHISNFIVSTCDEDVLFSLLNAQWESLPKKLAEKETVELISKISRDTKGLMRLISEAALPESSAIEYPMEPGLDALKIMVKESSKSFAVEMFSSSVVEKLQENDWLERFLGAWFMSIRTQAQAQIILETIRNLLRNIASK